jgi:hypothetical protein
VGNNGESLVADSSTSTGLRYTAGNPIANPTLNSAMSVWQRGTSFTAGAAAVYTADRWKFLRAAYATGATVSRQATADTTNLPFIQYAARVQRDSGNTSTAGTYLYQPFESVNSFPFAGKTVTFSFYARAGANYSATSNLLNAQVITGTGTDQDPVLSYTGSATAIAGTPTLTTTWTRFTYTGSIGAISEMGVVFFYTPVGTAGTNDYFEVTGVQIDIGSVALPFRTNGATIQGELAACQRYCQRVASSPTAGSECFSMAFAVTSSTVRGVINLAVPMRTNPTVTASSGTNFFLTYINAAIGYYSTLTLVQGSPNTVCWAATLTAGSNTAGQAGGSDISATGTAGANSVILSAEL